jgi:hypothetical protein
MVVSDQANYIFGGIIEINYIATHFRAASPVHKEGETINRKHYLLGGGRKGSNRREDLSYCLIPYCLLFP